jgi:hypothetical protein
LLSVFAVITAVGCGGASFVPVTGTVTLDGKPLAGAAVNFTPATAGQGQVAQGQTDESGKFTLSSVGGLGAVPGSYKIGVSKLEGAAAGSTLKGDSAKAAAGAAPTGTTLSGPGGGPMAGPPAQPKSAVPAKYVNPDQSGLTAEVKSGMAPITLELKSS